MATFEKYLLECKWRDVSFPITDLETTIDQDLVEHKYPDRDGAHVESMGRNPIKVNCKALFYNNISKGPGENWKFGILFPTTYLEFVEAIKDKSFGTLQHPFLGSFDAKVASTRTILDANRRDGVAVEISWVETIKIETDGQVTAAVSVISDATELDDALNDDTVLAVIPPKLKPKKSFLELVDELRAVIDSAVLIGQRALGQIDRVLYHCNNLIGAVERINSVLLANLKSKLDALKASLLALRQQVNAKLGSIRFFIAPKETTLGAIASRFGNNVVDIIKLNPTLAAHPIISRGTPVKYYKLV